MLCEGNAMLVIFSGIMTVRMLAADTIGVAVLHCRTITPLDEAAILAQCATSTG